MSEMAEAIRALAAEKGISEEAVKQTVENTIKSAYKKTFGTADNCIVKFADDMSDVYVYSRKVIVDGVYDPSQEIELSEALQLSSECEIGDEIDILVDPHDFHRSAVSTGKQTAHMALSESSKDNLYNEYKSKIGETIIGYYQREHNGSIYVDLGKVEGVLPKNFQSPREVYEKNDRIKAVIKDIKKTQNGILLVLSRIDPKFVESIFEVEVPEIAEGVVTIKRVVREAGFRTKVAVYASNADIDPIGSCVGPKGTRIQNIMRELDGERIDVLEYSDDPREFIKNALSPAAVERVVILDSTKKTALAIVTDENFSLAIGKMGQNVRLANRLCDWNIDVKTEAQASEMDLTETDSRRAAEELFNTNVEEEAENDEIMTVSQLPGINTDVAQVLKDAGYDDIIDFVNAYEDGSIFNIEDLERDEIETVNNIINENVEFDDSEEEAEAEEVQSEEAEAAEDDEELHCPECGEIVTQEMNRCPKCGTELEFVEE